MTPRLWRPGLNELLEELTKATLGEGEEDYCLELRE